MNGDAAEFFVNGKKLNAISELQKWDDQRGSWVSLHSGAIGLQAESAEVFYRNIGLESLGEE